ncbi:DNA recombination protein RmuC [Flavobacterium sp. NST-5]|uniref:DNA recombination protein RmuC n=1 Tax=Flavobacterium ichthyis TaxID=2698827 RepID=A0ABW9ZAS9_9FLAO|nr:DNA recombination protein RmuC [Flavobacterium ichthyis]NBL66023.1 DNA recombination protein RmuC [Flavobacterium ichthyis]
MTLENLPFIPLIICITIGFLFGYFIQAIRNNGKIAVFNGKIETMEKRIFDLEKTILHERNLHQDKLEKWQHDREAMTILLTKKEADFDNLWETNRVQKAEIESLQKRFSIEFENLAQKIFEEKSVKFTQQNKENLQSVLQPLQEKIYFFEQNVVRTHKESIAYHATLREQIGNLKEMNALMSQETVNLTKALKGDSKMRGSWGELILERVLEKSGLQKGSEYEVQKAVTSEDGKRFFPDVIINLPDKKKIIIDSKVSLIDYEKYVNEEDEQTRNFHKKNHTVAVKRHIEQLSIKNYSELYNMDSPDFVLLFVAIEPAFALALNEDSEIYNQAFSKNIVIVTPSTLLATLKTIDSMWANKKQQQNAYEIARQAGALYDKFEGFASDLILIGKKIGEAQHSYDNAIQKLSSGKGNLVSSVEKLKKLGAKAKKSLPNQLMSESD